MHTYILHYYQIIKKEFIFSGFEIHLRKKKKKASNKNTYRYSLLQ